MSAIASATGSVESTSTVDGGFTGVASVDGTVEGTALTFAETVLYAITTGSSSGAVSLEALISALAKIVGTANGAGYGSAIDFYAIQLKDWPNDPSIITRESTTSASEIRPSRGSTTTLDKPETVSKLRQTRKTTVML